MRVIVYTGKGGVGKTSVAAATGARLAAEGKRVLVVSTDAAHSLADAFDQGLGPEPVQVAPNLWGVEIDSLREVERNWGAIQCWLQKVMQWAKVDDVTSEELLVIPGLEELFALLRIREFYHSGEYDVLVVDCAPTGETLRMLSFPTTLNWWIEKIFPMKRKIVKYVRPVAKMVTGGLELPSDEVLGAIENVFLELGELHAILQDAQTTSVRIVLNPEKMVLAESRRSFTYLNLFGFHTDAVVINRVLPAEAADSYLASWRQIQSRYDEEIREAFSPLPILRVPFMETEVVGLHMLERVADAAFSTADPGAILYEGRVEELQKEGEGYRLHIAVGFASREEINLSQRGDELTIQVGPYKRKVMLPRTLMGRPVLGARFAGQQLQIRFGRREAAAGAEEED